MLARFQIMRPFRSAFTEIPKVASLPWCFILWDALFRDTIYEEHNLLFFRIFNKDEKRIYAILFETYLIHIHTLNMYGTCTEANVPKSHEPSVEGMCKKPRLVGRTSNDAARISYLKLLQGEERNRSERKAFRNMEETTDELRRSQPNHPREA